MNKTTKEIKAAYQAPEVNVHTVRVQQSFLSGNNNADGSVNFLSDDVDEQDGWGF